VQEIPCYQWAEVAELKVAQTSETDRHAAILEHLRASLRINVETNELTDTILRDYGIHGNSMAAVQPRWHEWVQVQQLTLTEDPVSSYMVKKLYWTHPLWPNCNAHWKRYSRRNLPHAEIAQCNQNTEQHL